MYYELSKWNVINNYINFSDFPALRESFDSNSILSSVKTEDSSNLESNWSDSSKSKISDIEVLDEKKQPEDFINRKFVMCYIFFS